MKSLFLLIITVLFFSSCSDYSHLTDDDVYVLNSSNLNSLSEDDETSYSNYKYNKKREDKQFFYGSPPNTHIFFYVGPRYNPNFYYPNYNPYYRDYYNYWGYSPYFDNCFNCPYYFDYYYYYGNYYPYSYYNGIYYPYSQNNIITNNISSSNTHYKARNSISGQHTSRRINISNSPNFVAIPKVNNKPSSIYTERINSNIKLNDAKATNKYKPIKKGVGVSGRRVDYYGGKSNNDLKFESKYPNNVTNENKSLNRSPSNNSDFNNSRNSRNNSTVQPNRRK